MTSDAVASATELRHGTASVRCTIVPWDTRIMGVVCGQLDLLPARDVQDRLQAERPIEVNVQIGLRERPEDLERDARPRHLRRAQGFMMGHGKA